MDPSKPSAATASNSTSDAELASYLQAMHLRDPSPARELQQEMLLQQHRHAAASREQQQQQVQSYAAPQMRMTPMMQQLQTARQFWSQPAYYPLWEEMGSSSRAPIGAAVNAFVPTESGSPYRSVAASPAYTLSASQYQPAPSATSTSLQYQHCPMANQSAPDYITQRLRAIRAQAPAVRRRRTLEETRSELLRGDMELQLVTFPDSAAHVVRLLQEEGREDHERIRLSVLAGATRRVHDFMDDREGHEVLAALLRACAGRYAEVRAIVEAAAVAHKADGHHSLLRLTKHDHWDTCLKELMTAAAPYSDLCAMLVDRLLREDVMKQEGGDRVLHHCFVTMRYEDTVILVHDAIDNFGPLLNSKTGAGSRCLVECYANARGDELRTFQEILLTNVSFIATGKYSNYFVQHAMQYGDGNMRQRLLEHIIQDVVALSIDCYGSYVVEACFQMTGQPHRVLAAFLLLDDAQLARLVQGKYSNYVVHKLLDATIGKFPRETMALARRIDVLLPKIKIEERGFIKTVMMVVRKLLARYGRMYG